MEYRKWSQVKALYRIIYITLIFTNYVLAQDGKPDEFLSDPIELSVEVWEILLESNSILSIHENKPFRLKVPQNPEQESYRIITDDKGEVHLLGFDLGVEEPVCESYLFRRSKLWGVFGSRSVLEQCSKEDNYFQCQALEGTVTHKNCREHVTETGDAVVIEMGTWYIVSYYSEIDLTIVVVLEGSVQVAPKIGEDLGPFTTITAGQIWVSQPMNLLEYLDIAVAGQIEVNQSVCLSEGLSTATGKQIWFHQSVELLKDLDIDLYGQIFDITFLPELIAKLTELGLDYPYTRIGQLAEADELTFPNDDIAFYLPDELLQNFDELDSVLEQIPTTSPE